MEIANVEGRGSLIIDGRVVDIESATAGRISSDPMELVDLSNHSLLAEVQSDAESSELIESNLGPPVPRPGKSSLSRSTTGAMPRRPTKPFRLSRT